MEKLSLKEFENRIVYKIHRRVKGNTMIHQVADGPDAKTLCGIEVLFPAQNIDPYDGSSIVDDEGMIITGFFSPLYYEQVGTDRIPVPQLQPTCAECSRIKQMLSHHCSVHGYLKGREVTFDEKCDYCGNAV